jgi:uncharacterized membrane protein YraQ (UPF0718 family)
MQMQPIQLGNGTNKAALGKGQMLLLGIVGLALWYLLYSLLLPFSYFFAYSLLRLEEDSQLGKAVQFFVYDTPKVLLLLLLIVFVVGIVRSFFTKERARKHLAGRNEVVGNVPLCWALSRLFAPARQCHSSLALFKPGYRSV